MSSKGFVKFRKHDYRDDGDDFARKKDKREEQRQQKRAEKSRDRMKNMEYKENE